MKQISLYYEIPSFVNDKNIRFQGKVLSLTSFICSASMSTLGGKMGHGILDKFSLMWMGVTSVYTECVSEELI